MTSEVVEAMKTALPLRKASPTAQDEYIESKCTTSRCGSIADATLLKAS